jgi:endonuclease-3
MFRKNKNVPALIKALKKSYSDAVCELDYKNPLQLLVATILSAQCTDKRVNIVTKDLFKNHQTAADFAGVSQTDLEKEIRSTGFYRNKAKNIRTMAKILVDKHGGNVPQVMDEPLELPGVARKTANVVLGNAFHISEGIVVDTHVMRLSERLGLTQETTPEKIEQALVKQIPREDWIWFSHALIWHGRRVCTARNPNCPGCPVRKECPNPVFP